MTSVPRTAELDAYLIESATGTHTLTVMNVGGVPIQRVECMFPSDASGWQLLEDSVVLYPIPLLEPGEARTALVEVATDGSPTVEITLRGLVEGVEYTRKRTLSLAATPKRRVSWFGWIIDLHWSGWIIKLGEIAVALAAIAGVATGVVYWLFPSEDKSADVSIERISPRTYGGWLMDEQINPTGISQDELDTPGVKVSYRLTTAGFDEGTELPVSVLLNDLDGETLGIVKDPFVLDREGDTCDGCNDWLRLDPQESTVFVAIEVFRPGVDEDPIASDGTPYCPQSGARRPCE